MTERHPATDSILRHFAYAHLSGPLADISSEVFTLAHWMVAHLPSDPELTAGLRHLLEAKDCFVRAKLGQGENLESLAKVWERVELLEKEVIHSRIQRLEDDSDEQWVDTRRRLGALEENEGETADRFGKLDERTQRLEDDLRQRIDKRKELEHEPDERHAEAFQRIAKLEGTVSRFTPQNTLAHRVCPTCHMPRLHQGESHCLACYRQANDERMEKLEVDMEHLVIVQDEGLTDSAEQAIPPHRRSGAGE